MNPKSSHIRPEKREDKCLPVALLKLDALVITFVHDNDWHIRKAVAVNIE
jgi:hypothetical protein